MNRMNIKDQIKKRICFVLILLSAVTVTSCGSQGVTSYENGADTVSGNNGGVVEENSGNDTDTYENGTYEIDITMEGGTGKASINSPVTVNVSDGKITAVFVWSSKNYDYMIVDGKRYENENPSGYSTFTVPVTSLNEPLRVIGDTVAMTKPHEIEYTIYWEKDDTERAGEETFSLPASSADDVPYEPDLTKTGELTLLYATRFSVSEYGDYRVIHIADAGDYLLVPEGLPVPEGVPEAVTILQQPLNRTYLVSTSVMDFVRACGCMDHIRLSGTKESDWSVKEARQAMQDGKILYAGKYRAPDYELILNEGCNLAIENTMIYHNPDVKEKLEELGIPVLVETSSYENHPLGRLEWVKLYGLLFGREQEALDFYDAQIKRMEPLMQQADTGVSAAFFHVTSNGLINVRKSGDYITKMIELSGGRYVPENVNGDEENALSAMNMQMEDFYARAKDADIIIYNSTISGEITSIDELIEKNALFADFNAVQNKRVYCTDHDLFQQTTGMADFMNDLNCVFTGRENDLVFLKRLE